MIYIYIVQYVMYTIGLGKQHKNQKPDRGSGTPGGGRFSHGPQDAQAKGLAWLCFGVEVARFKAHGFRVRGETEDLGELQMGLGGHGRALPALWLREFWVNQAGSGFEFGGKGCCTNGQQSFCLSYGWCTVEQCSAGRRLGLHAFKVR